MDLIRTPEALKMVEQIHDVIDIVEIGTILGEIGHTGATTGPHLHFEIRLNSQPIDPASLWAK